MTEIVEGLADAQRDRIRALRKSGDFFWIDVPLNETSPHDLGEALGIPEPALQAMVGFGQAQASSHKFQADGQRVAFAVSCYLEPAQPADGTPYRLRPVEVHVLISGDYLLTLHRSGYRCPSCSPRL